MSQVSYELGHDKLIRKTRYDMKYLLSLYRIQDRHDRIGNAYYLLSIYRIEIYLLSVTTEYSHGLPASPPFKMDMMAA